MTRLSAEERHVLMARLLEEQQEGGLLLIEAGYLRDVHARLSS